MHSIAQQKSSAFDEILYTAAGFELLDERHVIKNEKSCIEQTPSSTERISCCVLYCVSVYGDRITVIINDASRRSVV